MRLLPYKSDRRKRRFPANNHPEGTLTGSLDENIELLSDIFTNDDGLLIRPFELRSLPPRRCALVFIEGMVDKTIVNRDIIAPIILGSPGAPFSGHTVITDLKNQILCSGSVKEESRLPAIAAAIINGETALFIDGAASALLMDSKGWQTRAISEPDSERVVQGSKEGFNESLLMNTTLIRRRIKHPDLKFKFRDLGQITRTQICVCYIEKLASPKILAELDQRLDRIQIDGVLESGYIQEFIKDSPFSPFKTIGNTERPDVVAAKLLEGRIALLCDGTPTALTLPFIFLEYFQTNEDYFQNFLFASVNRVIRICGFFLATSLPAIYVALVTFHQEIIPTQLLLSITAARQGIPFPTVVEAIIMGFFFEISRESSTRMPSTIGQAISIVAALILGEAAVRAKLISAPMIIVTALTGITGLLIPKSLGPVIILRICCLLIASILGLYGYIFVVIGIFIHLYAIRSFGVPYMLEIGSIQAQDIKDTVFRAPWWYMKYRPRLIVSGNRRRQKTGG